jgi:prepilin-type N-terminal cleavage/methylation domain-containing protein
MPPLFHRTRAQPGVTLGRFTRAGFTLVEILVVLAISAILLAVAVPSFQSMKASASNAEAANALIGAVDLARSEAVRAAGNVTVCRSTNVNAPLPDCAGAGDWADGWIIFIDEVAPQGARDAGDDQILFRQQALNAASTRATRIGASVNPQVAFVGALSFQANGLRLPLPGDPVPPFRFEVGYRALSEAAPGLSPRCLQVNFTGQSTVTQTQCPTS